MSKRSNDAFVEGNSRFCTFYIKTGCCRHGDRCSRKHVKPVLSQTLTIPRIYVPPSDNGDDEEYFEFFLEDLVRGLSKYGSIEEFAVFENLGEHMKGNVVVRFGSEEEAAAAKAGIEGHYFAGAVLAPEFSPVSSLHEAHCREFDSFKGCPLGGVCNYAHFRGVPRWLSRELEAYSSRGRSDRSRDRGGDRDSRGSRDRGRDRDYRSRDYDDRGYDRDRDRDRDRDYRSSDRGHRDDRGGDRGRYDDRDRDRDRDRDWGSSSSSSSSSSSRDRDRSDRDRDTASAATTSEAPTAAVAAGGDAEQGRGRGFEGRGRGFADDRERGRGRGFSDDRERGRGRDYGDRDRDYGRDRDYDRRDRSYDDRDRSRYDDRESARERDGGRDHRSSGGISTTETGSHDTNVSTNPGQHT